MLPTVPGKSAIVLVALATMGGMPRPIRAGKVRIVPPPAMEFMAPATAEMTTITSKRAICGDTDDGIVRDSPMISGRDHH